MNKKHEEAIEWYAREFEAGFKRREHYKQVAAKEAGLEVDRTKHFGIGSARHLTEQVLAWFAADCPVKETEDE